MTIDGLDESISQRVVQAAQSYIQNLAIGWAPPDITELIDVTNQLPLKHLGQWELILRHIFRQEYRIDKYRYYGTWFEMVSDDGYSRSQLLRDISGSAPNRFFFALALRRLNDWVPQVRQEAQQALLRLAEQTPVPWIADALAYILVLMPSWTRIEASQRDTILEIASQPAVFDALLKKVMYQSTGPMPKLLAQLSQLSQLEGYLVPIAYYGVQPALRAQAYRWLLSGLSCYQTYGSKEKRCVTQRLEGAVDRARLLAYAKNDESVLVRRVANEMSVRYLDEFNHRALSCHHLILSEGCCDRVPCQLYAESCERIH